MSQNGKKFIAGILSLFSGSKIGSYSSQGLHKARSSYFCGSFWPSWIRIRNLNADPDPATQIIPKITTEGEKHFKICIRDPGSGKNLFRILDLDPQHCMIYSLSYSVVKTSVPDP
jgi:hypothetical protein